MMLFFIIALAQIGNVFTELKNVNYWSRTDQNTSFMTILNQISTVSLPMCVALCKQHTNCSTAHTVREINRSITCSLLSETEHGNVDNNLRKGITYKPTHCVNPCDMNPCRDGFVCIQRPHPECHGCICSERKVGENCDRCIENYAGPNCDVNVTGCILLDGIYFYIPEGGKNLKSGTDKGPEIQPNCTDSRQMCKERGMKLLTIKTKKKNDTVVKLGLHENNCKTCFYQLGLHRENLSEPFRWDSGELLGNVTNWQAAYLFDMTNMFYVAFAPNIGYKWIDVSCNFLAVYICEYDTNE